MNEIRIPAPHRNQEPILNSTARFKVVRAGRRFGKDRLALMASTIGHGPEVDGRPMFAGIAQGVDVAWVGPDFPQIRAIWREEIEPRFSGVTGVQLHQQERRVSIDGAGTLEFRSAENIDSLRGRKLGGCVLNEAAYFDLEYALREVIMPALMDLGGWVIIISTPSADNDGHETPEGKRFPSFFNILCEEIAAGAKRDGWEHWHFTSRDNPKIPAHEVEALYAEYEPQSPQLAQELDAKLITAGAGVAFPQWNEKYHVVDYEPSRTMGAWSGCGDWGYEKPGCLYWVWTGPERSMSRVEYYFHRTDPYEVGKHFGQLIQRYPPGDYITFDEPAVSDGGQTIMERVQAGLNDVLGELAPTLVHPPKGPGSRYSGYMAFHEALKVSAGTDGVVHPWGMPKIQWHRSNANAIRTIERLPKDPKGREDVDTDAEDHPFDAFKGWLLRRALQVQKPFRKHKDPDEYHVIKPKPSRPWENDVPIGERATWTRVPEEIR